MNISEIAEMAGVSPAAVSRYLNHGYVSEEKKQKIAKIIEETGYRPSAQARTLRTRKTKLIGVVIPKINSESISRVVAGIGEVLAKEGYQMLLATTNNDSKKELDYIQIFQTNQVDGIILLGTVFTSKHKKLLGKLEVPVVLIGQKNDILPSVYHDDYGAAKALTNVLLFGRKQVVYIGVTTKDQAVGSERKRGFLDVVKKSTASLVVSQEAEFSIQSGYEQMEKVLESKVEFDAVFCSTDNIAAGAIQCLKKHGRIPGKDVSIVGFGHSKMSELMSPTLTTAHFYYKTSGIRATQMLMELIEKKKIPEQVVRLGYEIIEQESTRREDE